MDYEWGVTFTGQSLLPIVVPYSWLPFVVLVELGGLGLVVALART